MAVEKAKVVARLKVLFPKANLSQIRLDALADKLAKKPADDSDDVAIDAVINDFNDVFSIEGIAKEDDRVRTLEAEKAKLLAGKAPAAEKEETEEVDTEKMTPFEKQMLKNFTDMKSELDTIKSGTIKQTKLETAKSLLSNSDVYKKLDDDTKNFMLKNMDLDSETPFEEQVTSLEGVFSKMVQTQADNSNYGSAAGSGSATTEADQKAVDSLVDNMRI